MDARTELAREVTFTPTFEDTLAAYKLARRGAKGLVIGIFVGGTAGVAVAAAASGASLRLILLEAPAVAAASLALVVLLRRVQLSRAVRKIYRQQVALRSETTVAWDADRLHWRSDRGEAHLPSSDFIGRKEDEATILLYASDALWYFIPKRILDPAQRASLSRLLASVPPKR